MASVSISWTNNDNSPDGGIDIERSTDSFATVNTVASGLSSTTTSYTDSTVSTNTIYEYRVERNTDHATATSTTVSSVVDSATRSSANANGSVTDSTTRSVTTGTYKNSITTVVDNTSNSTVTTGEIATGSSASSLTTQENNSATNTKGSDAFVWGSSSWGSNEWTTTVVGGLDFANLSVGVVSPTSTTSTSIAQPITSEISTTATTVNSTDSSTATPDTVVTSSLATSRTTQEVSTTVGESTTVLASATTTDTTISNVGAVGSVTASESELVGATSTSLSQDTSVLSQSDTSVDSGNTTSTSFDQVTTSVAPTTILTSPDEFASSNDSSQPTVAVGSIALSDELSLVGETATLSASAGSVDTPTSTTRSTTAAKINASTTSIEGAAGVGDGIATSFNDGEIYQSNLTLLQVTDISKALPPESFTPSVASISGSVSTTDSVDTPGQVARTTASINAVEESSSTTQGAKIPVVSGGFASDSVGTQFESGDIINKSTVVPQSISTSFALPDREIISTTSLIETSKEQTGSISAASIESTVTNPFSTTEVIESVDNSRITRIGSSVLQSGDTSLSETIGQFINTVAESISSQQTSTAVDTSSVTGSVTVNAESDEIASAGDSSNLSASVGKSSLTSETSDTVVSAKLIAARATVDQNALSGEEFTSSTDAATVNQSTATPIDSVLSLSIDSVVLPVNSLVTESTTVGTSFDDPSLSNTTIELIDGRSVLVLIDDADISTVSTSIPTVLPNTTKNRTRRVADLDTTTESSDNDNTADTKDDNSNWVTLE